MRRGMLTGLALMALTIGARTARADTNFTDLSQPGTGYVTYGTTVSHDGFLFTSDQAGNGLGLGIWRDSAPNHPVGGESTTSLFEYTAGDTTTITRAGGGSFGLSAIDLANWGQFLGGFPATFSVTFVGTRSDHTTVLQTFVVSNTPGPPQLQTFTFTGFSDLISVKVQQGVYTSGTAFQFDNLKLTGGTPVCDTGTSQSTYSSGDQVQASAFRFANPGSTSVATEIKVWFGLPGGTNASLVNVGSNGSVVLPAGLDVNLAPLTLFQVTPSTPLGTYQFDCRLLDPITGQVFSSSLSSFVIQ
jgi:hypothetical protein